MSENKFWQKALSLIQDNSLIYFIIVASCDGSAPNRAGAKILITKNEIYGTIGGGRSEYLLVEKARDYLIKNQSKTELALLDHKPDAKENASGMICSGSQTYAITPLSENKLQTIKDIITVLENNGIGTLTLSEKGLCFEKDKKTGRTLSFKKSSEQEWQYNEHIGIVDRLYIIGGGHCSLALSRVIKTLGFYTVVYENRESIQSYNDNIFANEKHIVDYKTLNDLIPNGESSYIAIMTYGHKFDQYVLEHLVDKKVKYLGMMGSESKVKSVFHNLTEKGISQDSLDKVYAPIGLSIKSNTPEEIAISISAELIKVRNGIE